MAEHDHDDDHDGLMLMFLIVIHQIYVVDHDCDWYYWDDQSLIQRLM